MLHVKFSMDSLGILACLIALAMIILSKAYKRHEIRLVIYFLVADIFQAITHIIELTPIEHVNGEVVVREGAEGQCALYGFLDQITLWMCNVAIIWIMLYMLWIANKLQSTEGCQSNRKQSICQNLADRTIFSAILPPYIQLDSVYLEYVRYFWPMVLDQGI